MCDNKLQLIQYLPVALVIAFHYPPLIFPVVPIIHKCVKMITLGTLGPRIITKMIPLQISRMKYLYEWN